MKKIFILATIIICSIIIISLTSSNVEASNSWSYEETVWDTDGSYYEIYKSTAGAQEVESSRYVSVAHRSSVANTELTYSHNKSENFGVSISGSVSGGVSAGVDVGLGKATVTQTIEATLGVSATWTREIGTKNTITLDETYEDGIYQYVEYVSINYYKVLVYKPKMVTYYRTVTTKNGKKTVTTTQAYQVQEGFYLDSTQYTYFAENFGHLDKALVYADVVRIGDLPSLVV